MSHPQNFRKQRGSVHIKSPNSGQSTRADEKLRDKDSRWAIHRRKNKMNGGFTASMSNTDHHKTTLCVLTQHSTAEWHNVPWLHSALIFCGTELRPHRYWSHSFKTIVKGKDVPVYTMKTYSCREIYYLPLIFIIWKTEINRYYFDTLTVLCISSVASSSPPVLTHQYWLPQAR